MMTKMTTTKTKTKTSPKPNHTKTCGNCGSAFEASHGNIKYCSSACRGSPAMRAKAKLKRERQLHREWVAETEATVAREMQRDPSWDREELRRYLYLPMEPPRELELPAKFR